MSKASAPFLAWVTELFFLFHKASRPALGPTQPPTEAGPGQLSLVIKQRVGSLPITSSNAKVRNECSHIFTPPLPHRFMAHTEMT